MNLLENNIFSEIKNKEERSFFNNLYACCLENNIPIIRRDIQLFLRDFFSNKEVNNILEIGTAVGFSAIYLSNILSANVVSIEKNNVLYKKAEENLYIYPNFKQNKIKFINNNALNIDLNNENIKSKDKYDLIFIDASKNNNQFFFEKFNILLSKDGYIITDNMNFNNLIFKKKVDIKKRLQPIVKSIIKYREFLITNPEFDTTFYDVGDGIAITKRKNS